MTTRLLEDFVLIFCCTYSIGFKYGYEICKFKESIQYFYLTVAACCYPLSNLIFSTYCYRVSITNSLCLLFLLFRALFLTFYLIERDHLQSLNISQFFTLDALSVLLFYPEYFDKI